MYSCRVIQLCCGARAPSYPLPPDTPPPPQREVVQSDSARDKGVFKEDKGVLDEHPVKMIALLLTQSMVDGLMFPL